MKTVLLYNFSGERLTQVRMAVTLARAGSILIEKENFCQILGYLIGAEGYEKCRDTVCDDFDEELLVMYGFDSKDIDTLIKALRKCGAGRVALKAIVTPTNIDWNGAQLYKAVKEDHEMMNRGKK